MCLDFQQADSRNLETDTGKIRRREVNGSPLEGKESHEDRSIQRIYILSNSASWWSSGKFSSYGP